MNYTDKKCMKFGMKPFFMYKEFNKSNFNMFDHGIMVLIIFRFQSNLHFIFSKIPFVSIL